MTGSAAEAQRLHPMTLLHRFIMSLPGLAILLVPTLRAPDANNWVSLIAAGIYGVFVLPLIILQYQRFRYRITPREIVIQHGVFTRRDRSIPIERVQNIEIEQKLLPRLFGTAKVKIETAGSTTTEGVLEYVGLPEARSIREVVRRYQREQEEADTVGDMEAPEPSEPVEGRQVLFTLPLSRAVLSGFFRFSLLYIVLIFTAMEYTGIEPEAAVEWLLGPQVEQLAATAQQSPWLVAASTAVVVSLLAWATGIAINVNRFYNFRLWLEDGKLRKRHGLLTLSEGTIPLEKVQALILRSNPLMRYFGWYVLELQTMGLDADQRGHQVAVPFAKREEILRLAQYVRPFELPETFEKVSPLTIRRAFVRYTILLLVIAGPAAYFWRPAMWSLLSLPLLGWLAVERYRNHGYVVDDRYLFVRRGVFRHHIWIVPVERFQVFYLSASLFQRRLHLRSLNVDTGGAGSFYYPIIVDLRADEAEARLEQLTGTFKSRMEVPPSERNVSPRDAPPTPEPKREPLP